METNVIVEYTYKNEYRIEGIKNKFNFFEELNKDDDNEKESENEAKENFRCLISDEPLVEPIITMPCGHKFNYIPLLCDAVSFMSLNVKMYNSSGTNMGFKYCLRCPYCRAVSKELLPFYYLDNENIIYLPEIHYNPELQNIEYMSDDSKNEVKEPELEKYYRCEFMYDNPYYDPEKGESCTNCPSLRCGSVYYHHTKTVVRIYNKDKSNHRIVYKNVLKKYCSHHRKSSLHSTSIQKNEVLVEKKTLSLVKQEINPEPNPEPEPEPEPNPHPQPQVKHSHSELKAIQKAVISLTKSESEKTQEDIEKKEEYKKLLDTFNILEHPKYNCIEIIKKGTRKGDTCNCTIHKYFMCYRHYKDYLKNSNSVTG
jgi:hypothetical protein